MNPTSLQPDLSAVTRDQLDTLHRDGIVGRPGAFSRDWVEQLREDVEAAFADALGREGGAVGRGPHRYYVEIHPEQLRGFVDLVTHPWVTSVAEAVLGPEYRIVEVGFDVPLAGAMDQPWHRDFAAPVETWRDRRYTSLAFNLTAVDTDPDMGPFEIAPGTQYDAGTAEWAHGMFPPRECWPGYAEQAVRKLPRAGDISVRSALTLHRGTANRSARSRPVLVLGMEAQVEALCTGQAIEHSLAVSRRYHDALPPSVRDHLGGSVVDRLSPIVQRHQIEGLMMGEA